MPAAGRDDGHTPSRATPPGSSARRGRVGADARAAKVAESGQVLSVLRRRRKGEDVAVLLDGAQSDALATLPFAGELEVVARSEPLPSVLGAPWVAAAAPRWATLEKALGSCRSTPAGARRSRAPDGAVPTGGRGRGRGACSAGRGARTVTRRRNVWAAVSAGAAVAIAVGCATALPARRPEPAPPAAPGAVARVPELLRSAAEEYARRPDVAAVRRAQALYLQAAAAEPSGIDALVGAVDASTWLAEHEADARARGTAIDHAIEAARRCTERAPDAPACDYGLALALGLQARERPSTAVEGLKLMVARLRRAEKAEPRLDRAGPSRVLALVLAKAPGWPLGPGNPTPPSPRRRRQSRCSPTTRRTGSRSPRRSSRRARGTTRTPRRRTGSPSPAPPPAIRTPRTGSATASGSSGRSRSPNLPAVTPGDPRVWTVEPRAALVRAIAAAAYVSAVLAFLLVQEMGLRLRDEEQREWWAGTGRDLLNAAGLVAIAGALRGLGLSWPAALLIGGTLTLAMFGASVLVATQPASATRGAGRWDRLALALPVLASPRRSSRRSARIVAALFGLAARR